MAKNASINIGYSAEKGHTEHSQTFSHQCEAAIALSDNVFMFFYTNKYVHKYMDDDSSEAIKSG
jgi:hypothetical protein